MTQNAETIEVAVEHVLVGDLVDLASCPYLRHHPTAELQYAIVATIDRETATCVAIEYQDIDIVGYPVGTILSVKREGREIVGRYDTATGTYTCEQCSTASFNDEVVPVLAREHAPTDLCSVCGKTFATQDDGQNGESSGTLASDHERPRKP